MKKNTTILLAAALLCAIGMKARNDNGIADMNAAVESFLASGQLMTKDTHWSHAMEQWDFKYVIQGDTLCEPQALTRLKDAFAAAASHSPFVYLRDAGNGPKQEAEVRFVRTDNMYGNIYGRYSMDKSSDMRIVALGDSANRTYYGMKWRVTPFCDRNGKSWCTLDGWLFIFRDGIWDIDVQPQYNHSQYRKGYALPPLSSSDQLKFETLMTQLQKLEERFSNGEGTNADLRLYILTKLIDEYDGQLTEQQHQELTGKLHSFALNSSSEEEKRFISKASASLYKHVRTFPSGIVNCSATNSGKYTDPELERMMEVKYNLGSDKPRLMNTKLTGTASGRVDVYPCFPNWRPYETAADSGRFTFGEQLIENQLFMIRDANGNSLAVFADSIPTTVNLLTMILSGSPLNERFAQAQQRLKALDPEVRRYAIVDSDGDVTVMDQEGYKGWLADVQRLQMQLMDENADNLIPVWFLANNYTMMSYDDLGRYLKKDRPYSNHVALQPVWEYYEGMAKRLTGRRFADAECADTTGTRHRLSEYIGKGDYVVLQFWEEQSWIAHAGCKQMKQMAKKYKGKNIRFVGLSLDYNKETWKNYVRKRDLSYEHLTILTSDANKRWEDNVVKAYGIKSLPETIIFDPKGRIISTGLAGESLKQKVESLKLRDK
ncbi:MAG: TlpA family protein disulfide reductase [Prevotella sp.]|nr:TlpA family protein disulfide reductase [Prevotella sp.]